MVSYREWEAELEHQRALDAMAVAREIEALNRRLHARESLALEVEDYIRRFIEREKRAESVRLEGEAMLYDIAPHHNED